MNTYDFQKAQLSAEAEQKANWSSGAAQQSGLSGNGGLGPQSTTGLFQTGQTWAGDPQYALGNKPHDCPHCGRCPCCGRSGYGYVPNYPQPYLGDPPGWMEWNKVYCGGITGATSAAICGTNTAIGAAQGNENKSY